MGFLDLYFCLDQICNRQIEFDIPLVCQLENSFNATTLVTGATRHIYQAVQPDRLVPVQNILVFLEFEIQLVCQL